MGVTGSRLPTMARGGWCASLFVVFIRCLFSLTHIHVLIPQDRCRFLTVQTDAARKLLFRLGF